MKKISLLLLGFILFCFISKGQIFTANVSVPANGMQGNAGTYCVTNLYTTGCSASDYLSSFTLSNLSNKGLGCIGASNTPGAGYADFTSSEPVINLIQGETYTWTATYAFGSGEYIKIWIDLNDNGILDDAGELIYDGTLTGSNLASGTFTLSSSAATGNHRLRVRDCYNVTNFSPCGKYGNDEGEVQDYTCNIIAPKCQIPASTAATNINFTSAQANWTCKQCTGGYIVEYGPTATFTSPDSGNTAGPNSTVIIIAAGDSNTVISGLASSTTYKYYVREDCSGSGNGYSLNSAPQTFTTLGTILPNQQTGPVPPATTGVKVLRLDLPIAGNTVTLTLDSIKITSKNTNDADITANGVKLWTGSTSSATTQIGRSQTFSSGTVTFPGLNLSLATGTTYYLWVTYDITSSATINDILDAKINAGDIGFTSNGVRTSNKQDLDPAGNLYVYYCAANLYTTGCGSNDYLSSFTLSNLSNTGLGCIGANNTPGAGYADFSSTKPVINLIEGATYTWTAKYGYPSGEYIKIWIDLNNDLSFSDAGDLIYDGTLTGANLANGILTIPTFATTGTHRLRVRDCYNVTNFGPCGVYGNGEGEVQDYTCNITAPECQIPASLAASNINFTTAQANWTCTGCTGGYVVEYGPTATFTVPDSDDTAGTNSIIINVAAGNLSTLIPGLATGTEYTYYVREDCTGAGKSFSLNSAPQTFTTLGTITAIQETGPTPPGTTGVKVLRLAIPIEGNTVSLILDSIKVTSKNTNDADISTKGVKLWTGTASSPTTQIGTSQTFSSGAVTFSGLKLNLTSGTTYYFWLTYDVASTGTLKDILDAEINAGDIGFTANGFNTSYPQTIDPAGNLYVYYCSAYLYTTGCNDEDEIDNFTISNLSHLNSGCSGDTSNTPDAGYGNFTYPKEPVINLVQGATYNWTVTNNYPHGHYVQMWIDYNDDGIFETNEELLSAPFPQPNTSPTSDVPFGSNITIPLNAAPGNHQFRLRLVYETANFDACTQYSDGEVQDYTCNIIIPKCTIPASLAATSVGLTSAKANWTCSGCTAGYIVEYGPSATFTAPDSGNTAGPNSLIINAAAGKTDTVIAGLANGTEYTYYIREDCSGAGNGYSLNSAPQTFTTLIPLTVETIVANQQTGYTTAGANNVNILRIDIPASGTLGSLALDSIKFTSENTNDSDITADGVKLWTGTNLAPVSQIGTAQTFSSGSVSFSGLNLNLPNAITYLWLSYNISSTAKLGDSVDAKVYAGDITITATDGAANPGTQPLSTLDPAGKILIDYCDTYLYSTGCSSADYLSSFSLSNMSNLKLSCIGTSNTPGAGYANFTDTEPAINLVQGGTYTWTASYGYGSGEYLKIWIDLNDNGILDDSGELIYDGTLTGFNLFSGSFTLSPTAALGNHRLRVRDCYNVTNFGPCGEYGNQEGEVQDYTCNIAVPGSLTISGYVKYDNTDSTGLANTIVYLENSRDIIIDTSATNNTGHYNFGNLNNDIYKLSCSTTVALGGENPIDALLANRHYIGLYSFTDTLKSHAADVNADGKINPIDALLINRRYINLIQKYPNNTPDWLFSNPTVVLNGSDISKNIIAICMGDVNGSYIPPARIMNYELRIRNSEVVNININEPLEIPIYLNDNAELGAMGIKFKVQSSKFKVLDVKSDLEGLIYNVTDDGVNIAWATENEGYIITPDKPLFWISVICSGFQLPASSFQITSESVLTDIDLNNISTDKLEMPEIVFSNQSSVASFSCYPNPFNNITNINFTIPEDANVDINLYNVLGEKVATILANESQQAGSHTLQYDGSSLNQGVYYCKLQIANRKSQIEKTNILMIAR